MDLRGSALISLMTKKFQICDMCFIHITDHKSIFQMRATTPFLRERFFHSLLVSRQQSSALKMQKKYKIDKKLEISESHSSNRNRRDSDLSECSPYEKPQICTALFKKVFGKKRKVVNMKRMAPVLKGTIFVPGGRAGNGEVLKDSEVKGYIYRRMSGEKKQRRARTADVFRRIPCKKRS